jgi:xylose isomerase
MTVFADVPPIRYEGPGAASEFAYRVYDKDRLVLGRRMEEWLRPAVCYWHSFSSAGADMFGSGTLRRPWQDSEISPDMAMQKLDAAFDFMARLGLPYFTFHDADVMATANGLRQYETNLREIEEHIAEKMAATGIKLLWGTANLQRRSATVWKPPIASAVRTTPCGGAAKATTPS